MPRSGRHPSQWEPDHQPVKQPVIDTDSISLLLLYRPFILAGVPASSVDDDWLTMAVSGTLFCSGLHPCHNSIPH